MQIRKRIRVRLLRRGVFRLKEALWLELAKDKKNDFMNLKE